MNQSVLFLCTGNSARSQMAEGWLRHLAGDRYEVFSAGTKPVGLNPGSVEAMAEVGIDIAQQRSKHVEEYAAQPIDYVVTVCDRAKEACPRWPGKTTVIHWSFDDPAAVADVEGRHLIFRRVRDEIALAIRQFLADRA
ncbi:MAG: arsenate reductase ArsC [Nitrospiraceae bacterium]|jgi:arsenate reductase|nr:arsenate reductase ArsC [Nitrospira sp.]MDW7649546.1 arsenate reductase ArsC [Nitrospiraceae bacterium]PHX90138.1 MAG: protein-tyrosine-phosphatase [Nitrospirota bacterium]MBP0121255.1 arsenate reductase ArsC [Nitrospira sp.]MBP0124758.1 arsenate reductase ArsC [Nitrospira sp.]